MPHLPKILMYFTSFRAFPSDYNIDLYKLHLEAMFKGLLVHLDDPTASIQVNPDVENFAFCFLLVRVFDTPPQFCCVCGRLLFLHVNAHGCQ